MGIFEEEIYEQDLEEISTSSRASGRAVRDLKYWGAQRKVGNHNDMNVPTGLLENLPSLFSRINNMGGSLTNRFANPSYLRDLNSSNSSDSKSAKKTQVIMKVMTNGVGARQVSNVVDYITRMSKEDEKTVEAETSSGEIIKNKYDIQRVIKEWSKDFNSTESYKKQEWKEEIIEGLKVKRDVLEEKLAAGTINDAERAQLTKWNDNIKSRYIERNGERIDLKIRGVHDSTHLLLSVGGKPSTKKAKAAIRDFLTDHFASRGFDYIFAEHTDTDNLHYHVVVKNRNKFQEKLRFDKADLFYLRGEFAKYLTFAGIERTSLLRKDRVKVLEDVSKGVDRLKKQNSWYQSKLLQQSDAEKVDVFLHRASLGRKIKYMLKDLKQKEKEVAFNKEVNLKSQQQELREIKRTLPNLKGEELQNLMTRFGVSSDKLVDKERIFPKPKGLVKKYAKELVNARVEMKMKLAKIDNSQVLLRQRYGDVINNIDSIHKVIKKGRGLSL